MKRKLLGGLLAAGLGVAGFSAAHAQPMPSQSNDDLQWKTFSVARFGTQVAYPSTIFSVSEGRAEKGVGEQLRSSDGRALLSIYSIPNQVAASPATYLRHNLRRPRSALQYRRVTASFFAISEETGGKIYYSRCNFADGAIHCFDLIYPRTEKRAWDAVVTRISRSLRPLEG